MTLVPRVEHFDVFFKSQKLFPEVFELNKPIILLRKIYDFQYISKILRGVSILMLHHPETIVVCWLIYC